MNKNKQLEQIKTEYKEIIVPEYPIVQMEETMERAMYHRNRKRKLTTYSIVVVVLLCIVLFPTSLRMGSGGSGFDAEPESGIEQPLVTYNTSTGLNHGGSDSATIDSGSFDVFDNVAAESKVGMEEDFNANIEKVEMNTVPMLSSKAQDDSFRLAIEIEQEGNIYSVCLSKEQVKEINQEIERQMETIEEQTLFLGISNEQAYYINEEGLLVVVWKEKNLEFIIPKTIICIEDVMIP